MDLDGAVAEWAEHGFVVLPGLIPERDLVAARRDLHASFPTADEFHDGADPARTARFRGDQFGGIDTFPFAGVELSLLAGHPRLLAFAAAVLGTDDVRVYGCEVWAKYAGAAGYEQAHHRDFAGHTTLVPSSDPRFRQLETFVYLYDVPEGCAPTRFVPRALTDHLPGVPRSRTREEAPELYAAEVSAAGPAGTVLAYSVDTFHRAVEMTDPRGARFTLQVNFRTAGNEWMNRLALGYTSVREEWHAFVERASVPQLLAFGFPPPGHAFWTADTLAAMAARYPGLDLSPWR